MVDLWLRVFYRLEIHGLENIPEEGPCVIVSNHSAKLFAGFCILMSLMRRRLFVTVGASPPGGMWLKQPGLIFRLVRWMARAQLVPFILVRRDGFTPLEVSIALLKMLEEGKALFLAPEGEVSWDGRLRPAQPGAAWLALRAYVPVVPFGVSGTYDVWPRWAKRMHLTGRIRVRIGHPFFLSEDRVDRVDKKTLDRAGERIMAEIGKLITY